MMKKTILFSLLLVSVITIRAQHFAESFAEVKSNGIRISMLDSAYKPAVGIGTVVFGEQEEKFMAAYNKVLQDLGAYLKNNNFSFSQSTRSFTRIYFKADGSIDYFLYNFKEGIAKESKIKAFDQLLKTFVQTYRIEMLAKENFVQCSGTIFQGPSK